MGYMRHHAIVVTTFDEKTIQKAHDKASELFPWVSPLSPGEVNGYKSFFIPPDGSKEGWSESDNGDTARNKFTGWCDGYEYEDGGNAIDYVEVFYGDDNRQVGIVSASNSDPFDDPDEIVQD